MLRLEHVTKYYGEQIGVEDLSFNVKKGTILGVLGTNGSGKSTTFRLLLGLIEKDSGKIYFQDQELDFSNKRLFGYLPEEKSILRDIKVKDQITYLARLKKVSHEKITEQMNYWLQYLHIEQYRNKPVHALSKGNVQLVQLVCALVHEPQILIFDEPLNGLDLENVALFKKLCWKLKKDGKIILISSHQYNNIEDLCDDVVVLHRGKCRIKGNLNHLKQQRKIRYLTLNETDCEDWEDESGVLEARQIASQAILKMESEEAAKKLLRKYMRKKNCSFKIEMISLQLLIKEALNESTDCLFT